MHDKLGELLVGLRSSDTREVLESLDDLVPFSVRGDVADAVRSLLMTTDDAQVRNRAALALADASDPDLVSLVGELLRRPATSGHRGTLLYALTGRDVRPIFLDLVGFVARGAFEERHQAFALLAETEGRISDADWDASVSSLKHAVASGTATEPDLARELLKMFDG